MTLRCPGCRTRRTTFASMLVHLKASGHKQCYCGGYHYPHRPFSRYCDQLPMATVNRAERDGATPEQLEDLILDLAFS